MRPTSGLAAAAFLVLTAITLRAGAQGPPPPPPAQPGQPGPAGQGRGRGLGTFPAQQRPPEDPALVARGRGLYDVYCRACHGADLRGGDQGGPNLLRSPVALADDHGESIGPVIRSGRQNPGMPVMPPMPLPDADVNAIAAYVRSVLASAGRQGSPPPTARVALDIVVGDPKAGEQYFAAKCATCHSTAGDLKGLATRVPDPMTLQNVWVSGGSAGGRGGRGRGAAPPPGTSKPRDVMVAVTTPAGVRVEGRLVRIDDFMVVVGLGDGSQRSFARDGDVPTVAVRDPLAGHKALLLSYTDKDIHDVTAFLVTLK